MALNPFLITTMKNRGMLYLSGGGDENKTMILDSFFLSHLTVKKMLFIPVAKTADMNGYKKSLRWVTAKLSSLSNDQINISMQLELSKCKDLSEYSAVYIGGGNTYKLLHLVYESGFSEVLEKYLATGGIIYGASAGAVLMGKDTSTFIEDKYMEENRKCGYTNTEGLGLLGRYSVITHFRKEDNWKIAEYFRKKDNPVVAIPEGTAVMVQSGLMRSIGGRAVTFDKNGTIGRIESYTGNPSVGDSTIKIKWIYRRK